ncbi:fungal specific transcription factor [Colletotrichum truncatum]|uniref:Fungal specific transcription factor n=1 Tax=Colletotrichum truncatum TaxID=5467 RepID=A0ACC3YLL5_COLTU|nr:fungal specific transcription factor [Colletotrichum truncatum]KAF6781838.1 fungal specific transcription factor [Colletotrichum truncatum]
MPKPSTPRQASSAIEPTRSYRSQKRHRPCDRCREMKLKCQRDEHPPCRRCQQSKVECTFVGRPSKRAPAQKSDRQRATTNESPPSSSAEIQASVIAVDETHPAPQSPSRASTIGPETYPRQDAPYTPFPHALTASPFVGAQPGHPTTQISQSLDLMEGHSAMLLGSSSGSDPWLLRHFRFDELGLRSFHKLHIRNAGGVPTVDKIPVHFLLSSDSLAGAVQPRSTDSRQKLDLLVPQSMGGRLVRLFHKHVFSMLPVISRTGLALVSEDTIPDLNVLTAMPTHLLAAIYGTALPFAMHDDQLAPLLAYDRVILDGIWDLEHSCLQEEMARPHLSVLQAALLYLHKKNEDQRRDAVTDTASVWPFMGTVAGLAHNLGLQLECRMMGLPAQEKRLRRRLWWMVYIQDKFLSLLVGRPPYIRKEEWDVSELDEFDFAPYGEIETSSARNAYPFRDMARLARVAETLQADLYSLKSCQKLAENLPGSIQAARPVFDALHAWRATIPAPEPYHARQEVGTGSSDSYNACVYLAYLTLIAYTWRALLRPAVRSPPPPQIIDVDAEPQMFPDTGFLFEDLSWDFSELPEIELQLEDGATDSSATIKELHQAAQSWAESLVQFIERLSSSHISGFWYSWSKYAFVVASNLLMLLLVQAPSSESGSRAKQVLEHWRLVLRNQSTVSSLFLLASTQLSQIYGVGLSQTFCLPLHVQDIL